jgi:hypothetical protein
MSTGAPGGASTASEEEIEDDIEVEDTSTSNVTILPVGGTFIEGTTRYD